MDKYCEKCGHDKSWHVIHQIPEGESFVRARSCKLDSCDCSEFEGPVVCDSCGEPKKPSQYARAVNEDGAAKKATDVLVCRNYPNCEKAEKEVNAEK